MTNAYEGIIESARLKDLKLMTANSVVHPFFSLEAGAALEVATSWGEETYVEDQEAILGACKWVFECRVEGEEESPVRIEASYFLHYTGMGDKEEAASAYLRDVGRMASYPYFRAHVASVLGSAALVLPPLPSIGIGTFRDRDRITARIGSAQEEHSTQEQPE